MSETKQLLGEKKAITPLWIVALFVSLTELVLGAAVTQTTGGIQVALTVFVITFPVLIAGSFFLTLWHKPYVFYPPTEFGKQTDVSEYVAAMQRRPLLLKASSGKQIQQPPKEEEKRAANEIVDLFLEGIPAGALVVLFACSIAHSKNLAFNFKELFSKFEGISFEYFYGFIIAVNAVGLININLSGDWTLNVVDINEKLSKNIHPEVQKRYTNKPTNTKLNDASFETFKDRLQRHISIVEQYLK